MTIHALTTKPLRSNLQSLQPSPPPHLKKHTPKIKTTSSKQVEFGDSIRLRLKTQIAVSADNVTQPTQLSIAQDSAKP
jgi:hypothetical protein